MASSVVSYAYIPRAPMCQSPASSHSKVVEVSVQSTGTSVLLVLLYDLVPCLSVFECYMSLLCYVLAVLYIPAVLYVLSA